MRPNGYGSGMVGAGGSATTHGSGTQIRIPSALGGTSSQSTPEKKKFTGVEDILEGSYFSSYGPPDEPPPDDYDDQFFMPPPSRALSVFDDAASVVKGHRRKELMDDKLRKPTLSVRRVKYICRWINGLSLWPTPLSITTLHKDMCSGLLLSKIMQTVLPNASFVNLNNKVRRLKREFESRNS